MTGLMWGAFGFLASLAMTVLTDMISEEVRSRLDRLPHTILRLAARRLTPAQRITIYQDEWLPELTFILKGDETQPITRLITGTGWALGILASADRVAQHVYRTPSPQPVPAKTPEEIFTKRVALIANTSTISHGIDFSYADESGKLIIGQCKQTLGRSWPSLTRSTKDRRRWTLKRRLRE